MSTLGDIAAMRRVIGVTGITFPRGLLGPEAMDLAVAIGTADPDPAEVDALIRQVAAVQWPLLKGPIAAALARATRSDDPTTDRLLAVAESMATDADPGNALALALAERSGRDLAAVRVRAVDRLEALALTGAGERSGSATLTALATATGRITADCLDLDPEDFGSEIAAYAAERMSASTATSTLTRSTGDPEIRQWARDAIATLDVPAPPDALAAVRGMAAGPLPDDPADDRLWTATIIVLAEEAIDLTEAEMALTDGPADDGGTHSLPLPRPPTP
ncbi:MAG: hypothetical protein EXQ74_00830 [Thermoleophilia bacterium]|nr:hypothetical protein [Thermoleophilia bacterium]